MNLIICLDAGGGYSFAGRRQSKDKTQLHNMLNMVGDNKLFLTEYSAKLFEVIPDNLTICEDPLTLAGDNDFCFIENISFDQADINKVVIYRWNRAYPSDKKLPHNILEGKKLIETLDFMGNSHEKITREIWE